MKVVAHERRGFGYRRPVQMGGVNHKKRFRLYREETLAVRASAVASELSRLWRRRWVPTVTNADWSLDFVSDHATSGRRFRVLTVVDDCTRARKI